jgi:AAA15 family ATPase/GTPase
MDNFRSYKNKSIFEDLANINIAIGSNNVGKSNLLKALVWYRDMHYHHSEYNVDLRHTDNRQNSLVLNIEFKLSKSEREQIMKLSGKNEEAIRTIIDSSSSASIFCSNRSTNSSSRQVLLSLFHPCLTALPRRTEIQRTTIIVNNMSIRGSTMLLV